MKCFLSVAAGLATVALSLAVAGLAHAGPYTLVTSRPSSTDTIDWGQLGPAFTELSSPQSWTSTGGNSGTVSDTAGLARGDQGYPSGGYTGFQGDFAGGDHVLLNHQYGSPFTDGHPITVTFNNPVSQAGAQIQSDFSAPFTAVITAYDSMGNTLASFSENGVVNGYADNSAIYIGIAGPNIASLSFGVTPHHLLAINQVTLNGTATPEPTSLTLLALGGLGLAGYGWRRRRLSVPA